MRHMTAEGIAYWLNRISTSGPIGAVVAPALGWLITGLVILYVVGAVWRIVRAARAPYSPDDVVAYRNGARAKQLGLPADPGRFANYYGRDLSASWLSGWRGEALDQLGRK